MYTPISFDIQYKYIYILLYLISIYPKSHGEFLLGEKLNNIYVQLFNNFSYGIVSIILFFISKTRSKPLKKIKNTTDNKYISIIFVVLLCMIDQTIFGYILSDYSESFFDYSFFSLLSIIPCSYFLFKLKFYQHHKLSIFLLFICVILITYNDIEQSRKFILPMLFFLYFGLQMSLFKYFMEKHFLNVYILCFVQSISLIIFSIIKKFYESFLLTKNPFIEEYNNLELDSELLIKILFASLCYVFNYIILKVAIFYLTPSQAMIGMSLENNIRLIFSNNSHITILSIIRFILELTSILIFNEIMILNFCTLQQNTMKQMIKRETIEKIISGMNNSFSSDIDINNKSINEINNSFSSDNDIDNKKMNEMNNNSFSSDSIL